MSRFIFAAITSLLLSSSVAAQSRQVPGRELLEFPLGLLAEAAPLSMQMTGGLWNPATVSLTGTKRAAFGLAGLTTPQEQGVQLEHLGAAYRVRPNLTAAISIASASVSDIFRTMSDPTTGVDPEIPYSTTLLSAIVATTQRRITLGLAGRYRWGSTDTLRSAERTLDAGAIVDSVLGTPLRLAASTFLFTPGGHANGVTYMIAADAPFFSRDSTASLRGGYSIATTRQRGRENYAFLTGSYRLLDLSGGILHSHAFGSVNQRVRLGIGLHRAGYTVAIGREDGAAGIGASYQFVLVRAVK